MSKKMFETIAILAMSLVMLFTSCRKEKCEETAVTLTATVVSSNNDDEQPTRGEGNNRAISIKPVKPIADYPKCIKDLFSDPEYSDWDFAHMSNPHYFDTAGFKTFIIPPKDEYMAGWNIMVITTEVFPGATKAEISQRYVMSFPLNCWDGDVGEIIYDYYYNGGNIYVEFLSYDLSEMFCGGWWDVKNGHIEFTVFGKGEAMSAIGYWDKESGFKPIEFGPFRELIKHWNDFNNCEMALTWAEGFLDLGLAIAAWGTGAGVIGSYLICEANGAAFDWMRDRACN